MLLWLTVLQRIWRLKRTTCGEDKFKSYTYTHSLQVLHLWKTGQMLHWCTMWSWESVKNHRHDHSEPWLKSFVCQSKWVAVCAMTALLKLVAQEQSGKLMSLAKDFKLWYLSKV